VGFGSRLKKARESSGKTQEELARFLERPVNTIYRWEAEIMEPRKVLDLAHKVAPFLGISEEFLLGTSLNLMGETDEPAPQTQKKPEPVEPNLKNNIISMGKWISIPVLGMETAACAGAGNGLCGVIPEAAEYILVDSEAIGPIDSNHPPFCVRVDGDSMEGAGIPDKSIVIINPAAEVRNGNVALVVYNDLWAIKWVFWHRDGRTELRSANPNYPPIIIDADAAADESWFRIVGPVVGIPRMDKPKGMF
jgi:phage repressor protein C with HTH and peptisase S24 domain